MIDIKKIEKEIAKYKPYYPHYFMQQETINQVTGLIQYLEPMIEEIKEHRGRMSKSEIRRISLMKQDDLDDIPLDC